MSHVSELLPAFVLGGLSREERLVVEAHLQVCGACARERVELQVILGELSKLSDPVQPPAEIKLKVMEKCSGGERFAMFASRVAEMLGVSPQRALELFDLLDDLDNWQPGPTEGCFLMPISGGKDEAFVGFIRLEPSVTFPSHKHYGREHLLLLSGGYVNDQGEVFQSGDDDISDAHTEHVITAMRWVPCVCALLLETGFKFLNAD